MITTDHGARHLTVTVEAPGNAELLGPRARVNRGRLLLEGTVSHFSQFQEYEVFDYTSVFSEPCRHPRLRSGVLRPGAVVRGGMPTSEGWVALDDDESWIHDDGQIRRLPGQAEQRLFSHVIDLPTGCFIEGAKVETRKNAIIVMVPHMQSASTHTAQPSGVAREASPVDIAPQSPEMRRQHSAESQATIAKLAEYEEQLKTMQATCTQIVSVLDDCDCNGISLCPSVRNKLGQLHGNANALLAMKIDAVHVSHLASGKEEARARRKRLIADVEGLIEGVEAQVKRVDRIRGERSQPAMENCGESQTNGIVEDKTQSDGEVLPKTNEAAQATSRSAVTESEEEIEMV